MKRQQQTVIHVEFHKEGNPHFYFGSISAVYELFNSEDLGVTAQRLYQFNIEQGRPYKNKLITIRKSVIRRKIGNRNNVKK